MTQAIVTSNASGLAARQFTPAQLAVIKRTIAKDVSNDELALFLAVCERTGLDPFARQIYAIVRKDHGVPKMVIQTGIDGFRAIASRSAGYGGQDEAEYGPEDSYGRPEWAKVTVYKVVQGVRCPFVGLARWKEFALDVTTPAGTLWKKMPYLMLAKCAEAQALRKAFPYETSQVQMVAEDPAADPITGEVVEGQFREVGGGGGPVEAGMAPVAAPGASTAAPEETLGIMRSCPEHLVPWRETKYGYAHTTAEGTWCNRGPQIVRVIRDAWAALGLAEADGMAWVKERFGKTLGSKELSDEDRLATLEHFLALLQEDEEASEAEIAFLEEPDDVAEAEQAAETKQGGLSL